MVCHVWRLFPSCMTNVAHLVKSTCLYIKSYFVVLLLVERHQSSVSLVKFLY